MLGVVIECTVPLSSALLGGSGSRTPRNPALLDGKPAVAFGWGIQENCISDARAHLSMTVRAANRGVEPEQWWTEHGPAVISGRRNYCWPPNVDPATSLRRRSALAAECTDYARRTGTLSKELGAKIVAWGFNEATASIDALAPEVFESTLREALVLSSQGRLVEAATRVVELPRIGISTASKLLAFPSGGVQVIYDHRAAKALSGVSVDGHAIPVPPSRSDPGTSSYAPTLCRGYGWYSQVVERLHAEAARDLVARRVLRSRDDIEMGLFMMGGPR